MTNSTETFASLESLSVRLAHNAAMVLEGAVLAVMAMQRELERVALARGEPHHPTLDVLTRLIDPINDLELDAADEYRRLTGKDHPVLAPS